MLNRVGLNYRRSGVTLTSFPADRGNGSASPARSLSHLSCLCDESIAALDVSIQAQVLNLFVKLKQDYDLTYLFISHDIGVIEHISDRVIVMYLGRIVETAPIEAFVSNPTIPTQSFA